MAVVYTGSAFNAAAEYKRRRIAYPFRDDPALGTVITRYYEVQEASYSGPALDAPDSEFTTAYCVAVKDRSHRDGEIMQYEVDFATIPAAREEPGSTSARFPGLAATTTANAAKQVLGCVVAADRKSVVLHVPSHGYTAQQVLGYHLVLAAPPLPPGSAARPLSLQGHALISGSSTHAITALLEIPVPAGEAVSFVSGYVRNFSVAFPARGALTDTVRTRVRYDYFLPGVTAGVARAQDIVVPPLFRIFGADGTETETVSTTTFPTQAMYEAMIVGRQEFLQQSSLQRWRGNIYERVLTFVVAQ